MEFKTEITSIIHCNLYIRLTPPDTFIAFTVLARKPKGRNYKFPLIPQTKQTSTKYTRSTHIQNENLKLEKFSICPMIFQFFPPRLSKLAEHMKLRGDYRHAKFCLERPNWKETHTLQVQDSLSSILEEGCCGPMLRVWGTQTHTLPTLRFWTIWQYLEKKKVHCLL